MCFKILFSKLKYYKKRLSLMDTRLLIIAGPHCSIMGPYNIGRLAIQQVQRLSR
jgi:hypothetical protein